MHIPREPGADPLHFEEEAAASGEAGVDQVTFNLQGSH